MCARTVGRIKGQKTRGNSLKNAPLSSFPPNYAHTQRAPATPFPSLFRWLFRSLSPSLSLYFSVALSLSFVNKQKRSTHSLSRLRLTFPRRIDAEPMDAAAGGESRKIVGLKKTLTVKARRNERRDRVGERRRECGGGSVGSVDSFFPAFSLLAFVSCLVMTFAYLSFLSSLVQVKLLLNSVNNNNVNVTMSGNNNNNADDSFRGDSDFEPDYEPGSEGAEMEREEASAGEEEEEVEAMEEEEQGRGDDGPAGSRGEVGGATGGLPGSCPGGASAPAASHGRSTDSGLDVGGAIAKKRRWAGETEGEFEPFPFVHTPGANWDGNVRNMVTQNEKGKEVLRVVDAHFPGRRCGTQPDLGTGSAAWTGAHKRETERAPVKYAEMSRSQKRRFNRFINGLPARKWTKSSLTPVELYKRRQQREQDAAAAAAAAPPIAPAAPAPSQERKKRRTEEAPVPPPPGATPAPTSTPAPAPTQSASQRRRAERRRQKQREQERATASPTLRLTTTPATNAPSAPTTDATERVTPRQPIFSPTVTSTPQACRPKDRRRTPAPTPISAPAPVGESASGSAGPGRQQQQQRAPILRLTSKGKATNAKTPSGTDEEMRQHRLHRFAGEGSTASGHRDYRIAEMAVPSTSGVTSTKGSRPTAPASSLTSPRRHADAAPAPVTAPTPFRVPIRPPTRRHQGTAEATTSSSNPSQVEGKGKGRGKNSQKKTRVTTPETTPAPPAKSSGRSDIREKQSKGRREEEERVSKEVSRPTAPAPSLLSPRRHADAAPASVARKVKSVVVKRPIPPKEYGEFTVITDTCYGSGSGEAPAPAAVSVPVAVLASASTTVTTEAPAAVRAAPTPNSSGKPAILSDSSDGDASKTRGELDVTEEEFPASTNEVDPEVIAMFEVFKVENDDLEDDATMIALDPPSFPLPGTGAAEAAPGEEVDVKPFAEGGAAEAVAAEAATESSPASTTGPPQ